MPDAEEAYRGGIIAKSHLFRGKTNADFREMIDDLHSYGSFLVVESRFSEAEFYLKAAAALASKMKPFSSAVAVPVLIAFAEVETHLDKLPEAQTVATSVVEAWRTSKLPPDIYLRNAYVVLGQIADRKGEYAVSEGWYDKALAIHSPGIAGASITERFRPRSVRSTWTMRALAAS